MSNPNISLQCRKCRTSEGTFELLADGYIYCLPCSQKRLSAPVHLKRQTHPIPEHTPIAEALTQLQWEAIKARYGYMCLRCKRKEPDIELVADHVLPKVKGGLTIANNTQPLCRSCNAWKHDRHIDLRPG